MTFFKQKLGLMLHYTIQTWLDSNNVQICISVIKKNRIGYLRPWKHKLLCLLLESKKVCPNVRVKLFITQKYVSLEFGALKVQHDWHVYTESTASMSISSKFDRKYELNYLVPFTSHAWLVFWHYVHETKIENQIFKDQEYFLQSHINPLYNGTLVNKKI